MNINRRNVLIVGVLGMTELLSGCITKKLGLFDKSYEELVSSVLISEDGKMLVVMTKDYHYIFDASPVIVKTLKSTFHKNVEGSFGDFFVDSSGVTTGSYVLRLNRSATEQEKKESLAAGYRRNGDGTVTISGDLKGKRYSAEGFQGTGETKSLNRTYSVRVTAEQTTGEKVLTPITIAADGTLMAVSTTTFLSVLLIPALLIVIPASLICGYPDVRCNK